MIQENLDNNDSEPQLRNKNITISQSTLFNAVSLEANDRYDKGTRIVMQWTIFRFNKLFFRFYY